MEFIISERRERNCEQWCSEIVIDTSLGYCERVSSVR